MNQMKKEYVILPIIIAISYLILDNLSELVFYFRSTLGMDFLPYFNLISGIMAVCSIFIIILLIVGLVIILIKPTIGIYILFAPVALILINNLIAGARFIGVGTYNIETAIFSSIVTSYLLITLVFALATSKQTDVDKRRLLPTKITTIAMAVSVFGIAISRIYYAIRALGEDYGSPMAVMLANIVLLLIAIACVVLAIVMNKKSKTIISIFQIILGTIGILIVLVYSALEIFTYSNADASVYFSVFFRILPLAAIIALNIYCLSIKNIESYHVNY